MVENDGFIKIYNCFMADVETYSHREQFIYFLLKGMANNLNGATTVDIEQFSSLMGLSSHSKNRKAIQNTLLLLEEKKLLLLYEDMMLTKPISVSDMKLKSVYYGKVEDVKSDGRGFTKIYYSDIMKFLALDEKAKDLMFSIYFNIIHRIYDSDKSSDYSWVTIDTIEKESGINRKTIMDKIAIMKGVEILYYEKRREGAEKDKNYYCRWDDRHKMINQLHVSEKVD